MIIKKYIKKYFLLLLLIFAAPFCNDNLIAAGTRGAGSSSFEFLLIPVGARETAMASGSAVSLNPNAFWWNPAGLAYVERLNINLAYNSWFEGITQQRAGVTLPLKNRQVAAVNISMLSAGDIEGYNWYGDPTGNLTSKDYSVTYSQAKNFTYYLAGGLSIKALFEQLADESNYAAAIDAGFILNPFTGFWLSGDAKNAGAGGTFIKEKAVMPISFFGGMGLQLNKYMLLFGDINYMDGEIFSGAGIEANLWDLLFLRAGYSSFAGTISQFKLGVGWIYKDISIDYVMAGYGKLGSTHRVDLTLKFGEPILIEKIYRSARKLYSRERYKEALIEFNKVKSLDKNYKRIETWLETLKEKTILNNTGEDVGQKDAEQDAEGSAQQKQESAEPAQR